MKREALDERYLWREKEWAYTDMPFLVIHFFSLVLLFAYEVLVLHFSHLLFVRPPHPWKLLPKVTAETLAFASSILLKRFLLPQGWIYQMLGKCLRAAWTRVKIREVQPSENLEKKQESDPQRLLLKYYFIDVPYWLTYDFPPHVREKLRHQWGSDWKGQAQKWFLLKLTGSDEEINLLGDGTEKAEFGEWSWMSPEHVVERAVDFKKPVYQDVLTVFKPHLE